MYIFTLIPDEKMFVFCLKSLQWNYNGDFKGKDVIHIDIIMEFSKQFQNFKKVVNMSYVRLYQKTFVNTYNK